MLQKKSLPISYIEFWGLGFVYFNRDKKRAEITFIHDDEHILEISIFRAKENGERTKKIGNEEIHISDLQFHTALDKKGFMKRNKFENIEIIVNGGRTSKQLNLFTAMEFSRLSEDTNDENDIRWLASIEEIHRQKLNLKPLEERKKIKVSKLFIYGAEFFTQKLSDSLTKDDESNFGRVAHIIGARIISPSINLTIKKEGRTYYRRFKDTDKNPVIIQIKNDGDGESDMKQFYNFFEVEESNMVDLKIVEHGGPVGITKFCFPLEVSEPIS